MLIVSVWVCGQKGCDTYCFSVNFATKAARLVCTSGELCLFLEERYLSFTVTAADRIYVVWIGDYPFFLFFRLFNDAIGGRKLQTSCIPVRHWLVIYARSTLHPKIDIRRSIQFPFFFLLTGTFQCPLTRTRKRSGNPICDAYTYPIRKVTLLFKDSLFQRSRKRNLVSDAGGRVLKFVEVRSSFFFAIDRRKGDSRA